jgi:hypothetical protein
MRTEAVSELWMMSSSTDADATVSRRAVKQYEKIGA